MTTYDFSQAKRGAIDPLPTGKTRITIRLDDDLIAWFRDQVEAQGGGNYQTLINAALREYVNHQKEPTLLPEQMELLVRQAVREELAQYRLTS